MVMHARKPQGISDGYFEKHQAHPYQKYSTNKTERRGPGEYSSTRYSPLRSPNGNVPAHTDPHPVHGYHHYTHYPEDRRNSYTQKGCVKERDRDYKSSRDKYTDSARSSKEKRGKDSEREHSNHERTDPDKKSRSSGVNSSISRSSKYDNRSAASSSSAPSASSEWSEHISSSGKRYYYNCVSEVSQWEKPREWDLKRTSSKDSSYSSRTNHEKNSTSHMRRKPSKSSKRSSNGPERYRESNSQEMDGHERVSPKRSPGGYDDGQPSHQDMDISPDRSTPFSENSYRARRSNSEAQNNTDNSVPPVVVLDNSNHQSGSLLAAALPRIMTTPAVANNGAGNAVSPNGDTCGTVASAETPSETPNRHAGPPTPTHSESTDPPIHLDAALPRKMECLGSYSSVVGNSSLHAAPMLTPSLVNYVRNDLTSHVNGWPADILDKQAGKFTEDAHQLGCLQCTRVSAELKCKRSLVRHTEIQATLQEQKVMYLRQQITRLQDLNWQTSFISDD